MNSRILLPAVPRLACSAVAGAAVGLLVGLLLTNAPLGILVGIAAAETLFVVAGWLVLWPMDAAATHANARREEFRPVAEELVVVTAALSGLVGIVLLLLIGDSDLSHAAAALALCGVFMSWAALHLMYAARYAYIYYRPPAAWDRLQHEGTAALHRLPLLQLQPGHDLPGLRHQRLHLQDPRGRPPALSAVVRVRREHPGHHDQPGRRHRHRLRDRRGEPAAEGVSEHSGRLSTPEGSAAV